jgi:polysaccharide biosynthesis/export protein
MPAEGEALIGNILRIAALAAIGWCLAVPGPAALAQTMMSAQTAEPYTLRPGDVAVVNVLEDPTLDSQVLVLPDGTISLPMAGTIQAAGLTPEALADLVRDRLRSNFVEPPNVRVGVSAVGTLLQSDVYVLGEVASPGLYQYDPDEPITIVKALALAGGVGPFAARERIQVRELVGDVEVMRYFDYDAFEEGRIASSRDLEVLSDGAVIVVPERGLFE